MLNSARHKESYVELSLNRFRVKRIRIACEDIRKHQENRNAHDRALV